MRCVRAAHCAGSTSRFIAPSENRISILGSAVLGLGWVWVGFGLGLGWLVLQLMVVSLNIGTALFGLGCCINLTEGLP